AALASLCAAPAAQANDLTVYGYLNTAVESYRKQDTAASSAVAVAGATTSRLTNYGSFFGTRGTEDLGGGLKSFFNLEGQFSTDTGGLVSGPGSTQLFRRQANVGLQGGWGTLTLGRQYSPALIGTLATEPRTFKEQFSNLY
ncbi:porin, partial [Salmonella enterica]|uniref:porin n=1 Tax=Salmonella enterica TaxID=28901 RepID=UPI003FD80AAE